jgi:hypothetical protein
MHSGPKARLTLIGRERLICQQLEQGKHLAQLAGEQGLSECTAASGWHPSGLTAQRSLRIVGVCAAPSGGCLIRSN